jgi:hypothetical protein
MKKIGIIIMCLLLYACNPETPATISEYTVTQFDNHRIWIIDYCGHEYMCVGTGGIVHLESCKCHK